MFSSSASMRWASVSASRMAGLTAMGESIAAGRRSMANNCSSRRFQSSSTNGSSNNGSSGNNWYSAYGKSGREAAIWLAKTTAVCGVAGYTISNVILTEENIKKISPYLPTAVVQGAQAFATIDHGLHAHSLPFEHKGLFKTYDHAALRRGYQVYREICAACHSMNLIYWRNLVGVTHTEEEAKAMAAEYEYQDGPNDQGEMFMRPGKLTDPMPAPYPNDEAARVANAGALPPDMSCIARARHGEEDYIFNLLLGYSDPPPGFQIREGLYFNRYFPGGAIGMARSVYDEVVDYEDGTPNNASQIAKDVSAFLAWASYPEMDERKKMGMKTIALSFMMLGLSVWWKRFKWSYIKSRKVVFRAPKNTVDV